MNNQTIYGGAVIFHEDIYDIVIDGTKNGGRCRFGGIIGSIVNMFIDTAMKHGFRCILESGPSLGTYSPSTDKYDGLIGRLQRKELDIVTMPVYYPLTDPFEDFIYTAAMDSDTMTICSGYQITDQSHEGTVFTMFAIIPWSLWLGYVLSFIVFTIILKQGLRKLNMTPRSSASWSMIAAFLNQYNLMSSSKFISMLTIISLITVFFIMSYAKNSMRTELVIVDKPIAMTSYDDIIHRNVSVALSKILPEWEKFSSAPIESNEHKLFLKARDIQFDPRIVATLVYEFMHQSVVVIGRPALANIIAQIEVGAEAFPSNGRFYVAPAGQEAETFSNVFALNSRHKNKPIAILAYKVIQTLNERGFYQYLMRNLPSLIASVIYNNHGTSPSLLMKISSHIEMSESDIQNLGWRHFKDVNLVLIIGLVAASLVLIIELKNVNRDQIVPNIKGRRRKLKSRKRIEYRYNSMLNAYVRRRN